jgi:hypothetical protein
MQRAPVYLHEQQYSPKGTWPGVLINTERLEQFYNRIQHGGSRKRVTYENMLGFVSRGAARF